MKKIVSVLALFVISLLMVSSVVALDESNFAWKVDVDGTSVSFGNTAINVLDVNGNKIGEDVVDFNGNGVVNVPSVTVEEGETMEVEVTLFTKEAVQNVEVEAMIKGYEYSDYEKLSDSTHLFDMAANTQKTVKLNINLPKNLDKQVYWLHLNIYNSASAPVGRVVKLNVEPTRNAIDIKEVTLFPGSSVKAGRSVQPTVLLENYGDKDQKDVKVTVSIPALGVTASKYVDVVKTDNNNVDYEDVEEMFLPIPATAAEGDYEIKVTVMYDDLRETVTKTGTLHVVADSKFAGSDKLVLAVGPSTQTVATGKTATYGVALTNAGTSSKAYTLEAVTGDWAIASFSDNLVVLEPGKNKVVYVNVAVSGDAAAGNHVVSVAVKAGDEVLETVSLNANVVAGENGVSLRNGLELALIVLVVLLVLIGLIIGFSRLRKDDEDEEQTYY